MKKETFILLLLVAVKFLLPFFLSHPVFELHRDEFLYYEQGQHLALGYLENPPLIGLLAGLSAIFGSGEFAIKFWPALFGAATLWLTVKMVAELGGGLYARLLAALGILFCAYLRTHYLFQPNFLDIFFWTLGAYFLLRWINTQQGKYIFFLSGAMVLGWYSKYSVLFFLAALLLVLLATPHRRVFTRKAFWLSLVLGFALVLPNLLWQYAHRWPLVHHMDELRRTQLQNLNRLDFLKEQLLMLLPVAVVWIGGLGWLLQNKTYRVIGLCYLLILALLMMGSGKGYYALGAYPMLLAAGGVWAERISLRRRWLRYAFVVLVLVLAVPFVPLLLPISAPPVMAEANKKWGWEKMGILKWEDGENHALQQDFADMLGWKELAEKTERLYNQQPDSVKAATTVYCANYGLAGGIKYYSKSEDFRSKIWSENGTWLLWAPERLYFKHLIYVDEESPNANDNVLKRFASSTVVDSCTNAYSRQYGATIVFFRNAADSAWLTAAEDLRKAKQKFAR